MKKGIIILGLLLVLCGCSDKEEQTKKLTELSHDYYKKYGIKLNVDEYVVTIKELKSANNKLKQNYDLKIFEECSDSTKASLTIKNTKITKTKINLNC